MTQRQDEPSRASPHDHGRRWCARCGTPFGAGPRRARRHDRWCSPCYHVLWDAAIARQRAAEREWLIDRLARLTGTSAAAVAAEAMHAVDGRPDPRPGTPAPTYPPRPTATHETRG